ncbi:MAG: hypothetical protein OJF60_002348 [Burkholderiaceae bacterium]|jgi:hypothetical protein|nr:MAG: hypothetical protein OJF60_002348 [Burkholderiaceae bacterium]
MPPGGVRKLAQEGGLTGNRVALWAIAACVPMQPAFTHLPLMQSIFGSTDLEAIEWLKVLGARLMVFCVAELEKLVLRLTPLGARLVAA